jgi:hypothetical protein
MPTVSLELRNTNKGFMVIHKHIEDDDRYCMGWIRGKSGWNQRHMQAYGERCKGCHRMLPSTKELEEQYNLCTPEDVAKLQFVKLP